MLYAWINGEKKQPSFKGERAVCRDCNGTLTSVIPVSNVRHWRHKAGDCDNWSESEGEWHLRWKNNFDIECREICLIDKVTGEHHRADILVNQNTSKETILELQHSNISEEERVSRENFYCQNRRMFWLVHLHNDNSPREITFSISLGISKTFDFNGREFRLASWASRSVEFIEKWKRSKAYVFFDWQGHIFFLANYRLSKKITGNELQRGSFLVCNLTRQEFMNSVSSIS